MFRTISIKRSTLGLLLAGVVVGAAGAQVVETFQRAGSDSTGLFTLSYGEGVKFSVSLDGRSPGPTGRVQMRLLDPNGTVKASQLVSLAPGRSATLAYDVPGRYRAQAEVYDSSLNLTDRTVATTVEVFDVNDLLIKRFVCGNHIDIRKD
jgi:hypothetical protein